MSDEEANNIIEEAAPRGRPNAFFARHPELREHHQPDNFGGQYRGIKAAPRGGRQTVHAEDTLGDLTHCWCGKESNHSWPGKAQGQPHPKENDIMIAKTDLRGYHADLIQFIMLAVNEHGLNYRLRKGSVILFPLDGDKPIVTWQKGDQTQIRKLTSWWRAHVQPFLSEVTVTQTERLSEEEVTKAAEKLAEQLAGPEHEAPKPRPPKVIPPAPKPMPTQEEAIQAERGLDWVPAVKHSGEVSDVVETNGAIFRCRMCVEIGEDPIFTADNLKSVTAHYGFRHNATTRERAFNPAKNAQRVATNQARRLEAKLTEHVEAIASLIGLELGADDSRVAELEKKLAAAEARAQTAEANAEKYRVKAEEAETRLTMIRESLRA